MIESQQNFWERIYSQNIGKMIGICYRYTRNRQLSEDLAHDAFLKAINKSGSYQSRGSFEAWLRRIVVNHVLQYIRDQKLRSTSGVGVEFESNSIADDTDTSAVITESLEFTEQELLSMVNELPEHHRLVFNLYVIDNFSHAQIAEQLGISAGTSKSHLARARKRMRELLIHRAEEKGKRRYGLLLIPFKIAGIDHVFTKRLRNFGAVPTSVFSLDFRGASMPSAIRPDFVGSWNLMVASSIAVLFVAVSIAYYRAQKQHGPTDGAAETVQGVYGEGSQYAGVGGSNSIDNKDTPQKEAQQNKSAQKKLPRRDSSAATILQSRVIPKTKNANRMTSKDSITAMLLMSSAIAFDSAAQQNAAKYTPTNAYAVLNQSSSSLAVAHGLTLDNGLTVANGNVRGRDRATKITSAKGTFYATTLLWSGDNHELYFKGAVVVDFEENDFTVNGSCSFLGPVYLVVVEGKQVDIDSAIDLSRKKYNLVRLTEREATAKYGEPGSRGAIEISQRD